MKGFNKTLALTLVSWGIMADNASALITIDTVPVGNAGNANDTTGYGGVGYDYGIGKYEVTLNQYRTFLNAVAKTDTYGLYSSQMSAVPSTRGIARSGVSGNYTYSAIGTGNRPVTYVSWFDAARFVNWLHNGQPTGLQTAATTEAGAYALNGATTGVGFTHSASAQFWIPSADEWYKAAYHQPAANGGDADNYWLYPTRSNTQPNSRNGSTTDANSANYYYDDGIANGYNGGYAANNSTTSTTESMLTPVGAFTLAYSYYGTFDQGGNVFEWNDFTSDPGRAIVGGSFTTTAGALQAWNGVTVALPESEYGNVGFRIAIVPEPSVIGLMALGIAMLAWQRKRTL